MTGSDDARDMTVTLIVHGTFAASDGWWRLGDGAERTFADRLEAALARRDLAGTVWTPVFRAGLGYDDFTWSGENHHRARRAGARKLADSVNGLAAKLSATAERPMTLNLVAHSHGGNVVLEAIRDFRDSVSIGHCVMLGTPLISFHPAFRLCRLAIANILLGFIFLYAFILFAQALYVGFTCSAELLGADLVCSFYEAEEEAGSDPEMSAGLVTLAIVPMILFLGWFFWVIALAGDFVWYLLFKPALWPFGRWSGQAYGPSPAALATRLGADPQGQKRIVLFTSHFDEAELLLQLGAAPNQLYRDYLARRWHVIFRVVERLTLRPIVDGILLKTAETILERFVFGIPWRMVLCFDYAIADVERGQAYPKRLFEEVRLADEALSTEGATETQRIEETAASEAALDLPAPFEQQAPTLYAALRVIAGDIRAQIKLRHSRYYQSEHVIERVAASLTGLCEHQKGTPASS